MSERRLSIIAAAVIGISLVVFARESADNQQSTDPNESQPIPLETVLPPTIEIKEAIQKKSQAEFRLPFRLRQPVELTPE